jgi:hypothetical protein
MPVDVYAPIRDEMMRLLDNGRSRVFVIRIISKKPRSFDEGARKDHGNNFWTVTTQPGAGTFRGCVASAIRK